MDGSTPYARHLCHFKTVGLVQRAPSVQQRSSPLINLWLSDAVFHRTALGPLRSLLAHPAYDPYYNWSRILPGSIRTCHHQIEVYAASIGRLNSSFADADWRRFMTAAAHPPREVFPREATDCTMKMWAGSNVWPRPPRVDACRKKIVVTGCLTIWWWVFYSNSSCNFVTLAAADNC